MLFTEDFNWPSGELTVWKDQVVGYPFYGWCQYLDTHSPWVDPSRPAADGNNVIAQADGHAGIMGHMEGLAYANLPFSDDQWAEVDVVDIYNCEAGVAVRAGPGGSYRLTGAGILLNGDTLTLQLRLHTATQVIPLGLGALFPGTGRLRLWAVGSRLRAYLDDALVYDVVDNTLASGKPGIAFIHGGYVDNFRGSDTDPFAQVSAPAVTGAASASATLQVQPPLVASAGGHADASAALSQKSSSPKRVFSLAGGDGVALSLGTPIWNVTAGDAIPLGIGIAPTGYFGPGAALSGSAGGHAGATALPGVVQGLAGVSPGHAGGAGTIPLANPSGEADAHGGASATLRQDRPLSGEADAHAGATAIGPQTPTMLGGAAGGSGGAAADDPTTVRLKGTAGARSGASATLSQALPLYAQAQGQAGAQAAPDRPVVAMVWNCRLYRPVLQAKVYRPTLGTRLHRPILRTHLLHEE